MFIQMYLLGLQIVVHIFQDFIHIMSVLTGLLLLRPQVRDRQLRGVALQPHEELLKAQNKNQD